MPVNSGLYGTLSVGSGSGTAIAQIDSISGPEMEVGSRETTILNPATPWRTFAPTITDGGTVDFDMFWDYTQATQIQLFGYLAQTTPAIYPFTVKTSDGHTFSFSAFITKFALGEQTIDSNVTASMSLKVSGAVVPA